MAMRDGFEKAKSTADLRERKWSSSYCSHRAGSCHSHIWSFEISAALQSPQPIWLVGKRSKSRLRSNLEQGKKCIPWPEAHLDIRRLHDQDAQRDTLQEAPVYGLDHISQMPVVPLKQISPVPCLPGKGPAPQSNDLGLWAQQGNRRTMSWKMGLRAAVCASQNSLSSQSCKPKLVCSSRLSEVTTNEHLQKHCYFLFPLHCSLSLFSVFLGHTMLKDVIWVVSRVFS